MTYHAVAAYLGRRDRIFLVGRPDASFPTGIELCLSPEVRGVRESVMVIPSG